MNLLFKVIVNAKPENLSILMPVTLLHLQYSLLLIFYRHSVRNCGSSKLYVPMCMSRIYGLYLDYYRSEFDKTL